MKRAAAMAAALLAVAAMVSPGCGTKQAAGGRLKVAATILPLCDFVRFVGGDLVDARLLVPAGASPHTFEPTSGTTEFISDADVLVSNGSGSSGWIEKSEWPQKDRTVTDIMAAEKGGPRGGALRR